jgi:WD repeat-containing protein 6
VTGSKTTVTALLLQDHLLFVGEGRFLRIYDELNSAELYWGQGFKTQTIHGFTPLKSSNKTTRNILLWGGRYLKTLSIAIAHKSENGTNNALSLSSVILGEYIQSPDWILDVCEHETTVIALTSHNELLHIDMDRNMAEISTSGLSMVLFSAHLTVIDDRKVLVAGGTAFGDVLVWSCFVPGGSVEVRPVLHYIFSGHEGSIFGVRISEVLNSSTKSTYPRRIVSSCSDDRTIRVWDISDLSGETKLDNERRTGFGSSEENNHCIATVMGHMSRIWQLRYVYNDQPPDHLNAIVRILSVGEDTTCQSWDLLGTNPDTLDQKSTRYSLRHIRTVSCHDGKNIWAIDVASDIGLSGEYRVITGGADGAIVSFDDTIQTVEGDPRLTQTWELYQSSVNGGVRLIHPDDAPTDNLIPRQPKDKRLHIRTIALLSETRILAITNNGHGLINNPNELSTSKTYWQLAHPFTKFIGEQFHHLAPTPDGHFLFMVSKSRKDLYCFDVQNQVIYEVHDFKEPISGLWGAAEVDSAARRGKKFCLLVSFLRSKTVHFVILHKIDSGKLEFEHSFTKMPSSGTNQVVTSYIPPKSFENGLLAVGYRHGNVDIFSIPDTSNALEVDRFLPLKHTIGKAHGDDAVTGLAWFSSPQQSDQNLLLSSGRDGHFIVYSFEYDQEALICNIVHRIALPTGTCLEGLFVDLRTSTPFVYGFQSTQFVVYNVKTLQQAISIQCGSHRTWCFRPRVEGQRTTQLNPDFLGSFIWLQASKVKSVQNLRPSRQFLQHGAHGREIKAAAITTMSWRTNRGNECITLLTTGAEDTNIRISIRHEKTESEEESFHSVAVLKRHTTGIQRLAWVGDWLFSSASLEEFYIWKVSYISGLGLVVRFESACPWRSDDADSRIMGFKVGHSETETKTPTFIISLAYSNSILKVRFTMTEIHMANQLVDIHVYVSGFQ